MATITLSGSASGLIKYAGNYTAYIPISSVGYFQAVSSARISITCGSYITELDFDDTAQRDAAITTLLTYF